MSDKTRYITINFNNGRKQKFEFMPIASDPNMATMRFEQMLDSGRLVLNCDGRLHVIPFANVDSFEISPAPEKIPYFVVKAIRELE